MKKTVDEEIKPQDQPPRESGQVEAWQVTERVNGPLRAERKSLHPMEQTLVVSDARPALLG